MAGGKPCKSSLTIHFLACDAGLLMHRNMHINMPINGKPSPTIPSSSLRDLQRPPLEAAGCLEIRCTGPEPQATKLPSDCFPHGSFSDFARQPRLTCKPATSGISQGGHGQKQRQTPNDFRINLALGTPGHVMCCPLWRPSTARD